MVHRAVRRPKVRVLPAVGDAVRVEYAYLKRDVPNAERVYRRVPKSQKRTIKINQGHVFFALELQRVNDNLYREPPREDTDGSVDVNDGEYQYPYRQQNMVAIKKVHKRQVHAYLKQGGHENPYMAIHRMQTLGDDHHVLSCIEALEDDKYLYTIMRYCEGRSILDMVPWDSPTGVNEDLARDCMQAVTENLHYLQSHGIAHHDISPDNILCLNGRLLLVDLAMSLRVPDGNTDHRRLLKPQGIYGKPPYMSPEVLMSRGPFDAFALDVWAAGCVLYNLLTSYYLFKIPHPSDAMFRYFLMAGALSNEPVNERTVEVMVDVFQTRQDQEDRQNLLSRAMAHLHLSTEAMDLLHRILRLNPRDRATLANVMESNWMMDGRMTS